MHNAWTIASRPASSCLRAPLWSVEKSSLRSAFSVLANIQPSRTRDTKQLLPDRPTHRLSLDRRKHKDGQARPFSSSTRSSFQTSPILQKLKPYKPGALDQGLAFRTQDLTQRELAHVFGRQIPPANFANRLLRILHGRRVDGTLDIDPPEDVTSQLQKYPYAAADALKWLRTHYPIDEDAAIMRRLEREESAAEKDNPAELMQRAEKLGLYKPQSGTFGAKLGDEGDVFGESELEKIRAANIAEAKREEEALEEQIQQLQKETKEKVGQLQIRDDNSLEGIKRLPVG
jgi:rhomboid-like protein